MTQGMRKGLTSYGDPEFSLFLRKAFVMAMGYSEDALNRPIIGIANTYSDYNPCHGNVPDLIEAVKRGVMLAGAMPMVFPTITIHESFVHRTSMYLRNLMAMVTEEMIRAQPMDAVVLKACAQALGRREAPGTPARGYARLFQEHILQADEGCDFDFLVEGRASAGPSV
jgi:dihydroxyacid dehydratase/phosphogluconate dehydratase